MSEENADRDAIIALIHRHRIAIWTHDFDDWEKCFVHAPYTARWGWWQSGGTFVRRGWDDIRRRARAGAPPIRQDFAHDTEVLNLSLRIGADMAWAIYDQQYPEPEPVDDEGGTGLTREARVFEKHGGEWKIAFLGFLAGAGGGRTVIGLGADCSVTRLNTTAVAALAVDDNLVVRNGILRFRDRRLDHRLNDAVKWAASLDTALMSHNGALPILAEAGEGLPTRIYWVVADAGLILFSFGEQHASEQRLDVAATIYGLSPMQRRLAGLVAEGLTLNAIADRMEIKPNTARTHLNRVFDKTGVHTQPALVRVLLTAISPV